MSSMNYTLRLDKSDKQKAEQVFKALGMTFSTGINIYVKSVGRHQKIPFDLSLRDQDTLAVMAETSKTDRNESFSALDGILAGYHVDLDKEREERNSTQ